MNTVLFLIIGIPLIEIYLFIKIGSQIGAFNTVLLILITAVLGKLIKKKQRKEKEAKNYIDGEYEDLGEDNAKKI